jgi:SRSO17 transposase
VGCCFDEVALAGADAPQPAHEGVGLLRVRRPAGLPVIGLVRVAGTRWRVEKAFQAGKQLCGLDQHQVRRRRSWYRWVTLARLAHAFLVWPR